MSHDRFRYGLIGAAFCVSVLFFIRLPAIVGRHVRIPLLDFARISISFTVVAAALAIVLIFKSLAKRDPLRRNYERFRRTYDIFLDLAVVLAIGVHILLLLTVLVLKPHGLIGRWISFVPTCLVGFILIVAGNTLPRLRPNSAMGVRTRWTLGDEAVWRKTHLAAGYVLIVFGLALIAWTFIDFQGIWWVLGPGAIVTMLGLPLLSWAIAKRALRAASPPSQP